ncbi:MAG: 50S ribosomal protein L10 [Planctomycetes bacterium]|nr:50S ribosomal protein L10 [Planctomycetota bacterium]
MSKRIKNMLSEAVKAKVGEHRDFVVVDNSKLDGVTINNLRLKLLKSNIRMLWVKNSLACKVLGDLGLNGLESCLAGPSTLVYGGPDIVALSKEITKWAKDIEALQIKGGVVEGNLVDANQVVALSKSPSREELLGRVVTLMLSPGATLAGALLGSGGTVVGQIKAIADKEPEAAPAAAS